MATNMNNGAYSTLASGITAGATSLSVASGTGSRFPSSNFYISVYDSIDPNWSVAYQNGRGEIMLCSSRSTDTLTVTRAQGGTSAVAFNTTGRTYRVENNVTAEAFAVATASASGLVSTSAQAFSGVKTFNDGINAGVASTTDGYILLYNSSNAGTVSIYPPVGGVTGSQSFYTPATGGTLAKTTDIKQVVAFGVDANIGTSSQTLYLAMNAGNATAGSSDNVNCVVPFACTASNLYFKTGTAWSGGTISAVATLRKNSADTAITLSFSQGTTTANDTTHSVSFAAGDTIALKLVVTNTSGAGNLVYPRFTLQLTQS